MLAVEGLVKRFGGFTAVSNVSFKVDQGEILGLIGPNGSGKSTVLEGIELIAHGASELLHPDQPELEESEAGPNGTRRGRLPADPLRATRNQGFGVLRGPKQVGDGWKRFYDGAKAPFSREPEQVEVLDSGTLALSSGPVWDPDHKRIGTFSSIWRRDSAGKWKIVFDKGCPPCNCAQ